MKIEEFDKHGKVRFNDDEYVLVGVDDPGRFTLAVKVGERCNAEGFYLARWLMVDAYDAKSILGVAEETDYRIYFNPETEEIDMVQT